MRGAHVQKKEHAAVRQGWRNRCYTAPPAEIKGLFGANALRQGPNSPDAQVLDTSQPGRLRSTPGRARDTMLSGSSLTDVSGVARRGLYRKGRRKPVLLSHEIKNPDMALDLDALLAESTTNKRLGKATSKLSLPVHIWYLWSATGIKSGTSENRNRATGIKSGTCGGGFGVPQVSNMNHSY